MLSMVAGINCALVGAEARRGRLGDRVAHYLLPPHPEIQVDLARKCGVKQSAALISLVSTPDAR